MSTAFAGVVCAAGCSFFLASDFFAAGGGWLLDNVAAASFLGGCCGFCWVAGAGVTVAGVWAGGACVGACACSLDFSLGGGVGCEFFGALLGGEEAFAGFVAPPSGAAGVDVWVGVEVGGGAGEGRAPSLRGGDFFP